MLSQTEFAGWARAIGAPELLADPRYADMATRFLNWNDLRAFSAPRIAALSTAQAVARLGEAGVPGGVAHPPAALAGQDRKGGAEGKLVSVRVGRGVRMSIYKQNNRKQNWKERVIP